MKIENILLTLVMFIASIVGIYAQGIIVYQKDGTTQYYSYARIDSIVAYDNSANHDNGYEFVDLGLSVKWATCNVGAMKPEEYGNYYAWGETSPKESYSWSTYKYANGSQSSLTKYCNQSSQGYNGFTDDKTTLDTEDDAATVNWQGHWRMPTLDEVEELINNCSWGWTNQNGVNGYVVIGKTGNSIFLPASGRKMDGLDSREGITGYLWTSNLNTNRPYAARYIIYGSTYHNTDSGSWYDRINGMPVRAVIP